MFQLRVRAQDNGSPRLFDVEIVTITVNRNLNTPQFLQSAYIVSILETTSPGTQVLQVQARDNDISVSQVAYLMNLFDTIYTQVNIVSIMETSHPDS